MANTHLSYSDWATATGETGLTNWAKYNWIGGDPVAAKTIYLHMTNRDTSSAVMRAIAVYRKMFGTNLQITKKWIEYYALIQTGNEIAVPVPSSTIISETDPTTFYKVNNQEEFDAAVALFKSKLSTEEKEQYFNDSNQYFYME